MWKQGWNTILFVTLSCAEHHWPDIIRLVRREWKWLARFQGLL
jgi:hypothetical protein